MNPQERLAAALSVALHDEEPRWSPTGVRLFSDAVVAADPALAADIELGQEWRLTEAALPEGWTLSLKQIAPLTALVAFEANAREQYGHWRIEIGTGPTAVAALRALRGKLEEVTNGQT